MGQQLDQQSRIGYVIVYHEDPAFPCRRFSCVRPVVLVQDLVLGAAFEYQGRAVKPHRTPRHLLWSRLTTSVPLPVNWPRQQRRARRSTRGSPRKLPPPFAAVHGKTAIGFLRCGSFPAIAGSVRPPSFVRTNYSKSRVTLNQCRARVTTSAIPGASAPVPPTPRRQP